MSDFKEKLAFRKVESFPDSMNRMKLTYRFSESTDNLILVLQIIKVNFGLLRSVFLLLGRLRQQLPANKKAV